MRKHSVRKHRKGIIGGGIIGGVLAIAAAAFAAIILTVSIGGKTAVANETASLTVSDATGMASGSVTACDVSASGDSLTINPTAHTINNQSQDDGTCTVTAKITNTGDTTAQFTGIKISDLPAGWYNSAPVLVNGSPTLAPGDSLTGKIVIGVHQGDKPTAGYIHGQATAKAGS